MSVLLLVELVGPDSFRHYRNELFPFVMGFSTECGLETQWLTLPFDPAERIEERFFVELSDDSRDRLLAVIREQGATHALFNESLSPSLWDTLAQGAPDLKILSIGDMSLGEGYAKQYQRPDWLGEWLDLAPEAIGERGDRALIEAVKPIYRRRVAPDTVTEHAAFLKILCGAECGYRRSIEDNPYYADIDLSKATHTVGCSFCFGGAAPPHRWPLETPAFDLIFRQLEEATAVCRDDPLLARFHSAADDDRLHFLMLGSVVLTMLKKFLERLVTVDLPPSIFLISCRADEFLARRLILDEWLPRLAEKDHAIHVWVMGVENFSEQENQRLNKNMKPERIIEAQALIAEYEEAYPRAFGFNKYGGLSFILFTPWTTIEDLRTNAIWARKAGIEPRGFFLRSRVQLLPDTPITLLAKSDDLLVESRKEAYFDSGCVQSWHDLELYWRFQQREIGVVYRISSRLPPEQGDLDGDAVYELIQEKLYNAYLSGFTPLDAFESLLDAVEQHPEERSIDLILDRVQSSLKARSPDLALTEDDGPGLAGASPTLTLTEDDGPELAGSSPTLTPLFVWFSERFASYMEERGGRIKGYRLIETIPSVSDRGSPGLRLDFEDDEEDIFSLIVERRVRGKRYLVMTAALGVTYSPETTPDTRKRQQLLYEMGFCLADPRFRPHRGKR
jgi:hypothetical protein